MPHLEKQVFGIDRVIWLNSLPSPVDMLAFGNKNYIIISRKVDFDFSYALAVPSSTHVTRSGVSSVNELVQLRK